MIFQTDIEAAVSRSLPGEFEKRDLLALGIEFNRLHEREAKADLEDAEARCEATKHKWKMVTIVGWLIAIALLLALSLLGL